MLRLAMLGLDTVHAEWLSALGTLHAQGEIQLVGGGHASAAAAREMTTGLGGSLAVPAYDDPRRLLRETNPQLVVLDRPSNVGLDFLRTCLAQGIGIFSLGPPVESLAEAQALAEILEPRTHLLQVWPHFADSPAVQRCAQADDFLRPIRFASAAWLGTNYAVAKTLAADAGHGGPRPMAVRSLSVLAWDLLGTLVGLMGVPSSVYAVLRGTGGSGHRFTDLSGAAAITLRYPDDAAANLTLCDRLAADAARRELLLLGNGSLQVMEGGYEFRDEGGRIIDAAAGGGRGSEAGAADKDPGAALVGGGSAGPASGAGAENGALAALREFIRTYVQPASPHRGRLHCLEEIAATLEAVVVSHRTGQPESPDRLRQLRR